MGTDDEKCYHNPDTENLKSLLKKSDKKVKKNHHVIFNENKNQFFEADYIILIREECEYNNEDDRICTCNQHGIVQLTCEPNCNCNVFEESDVPPQSPKFAPPLEFVDAATLSPPEGYKDMEMEEQHSGLRNMTYQTQRSVVCRECRANHEGDEGASESLSVTVETRNNVTENENIDRCQQTTPTSSMDDIQHYTLDIPLKSPITQEDISDHDNNSESDQYSTKSSASGILKQGQFWKNQETGNSTTISENTDHPESSISSDESCNRRSVRFVESVEENRKDQLLDNTASDNMPNNMNNASTNTQTSKDDEMMLTFKLGNHMLISNNSLKPNSAVRQLFPCTNNKSSIVDDKEVSNKYLITAESLRAFEEAKRSKLPQLMQCGNTNENIKRVIERNTLKRSLIRCEPKNRKNTQKTDNSLVELIKQLTCNESDEDQKYDDETEMSQKENVMESLEVNCDLNKCDDKTCSPSSSSTTSSTSSSSSTYKKISDLFNKRERASELQCDSNKPKAIHFVSDINARKIKVIPVADNKRQFFSTFAPLSACVGSMGLSDDARCNINNAPCEQKSVTSTICMEDTLGNINEGTLDICAYSKLYITPDVLAGTPISTESREEFMNRDTEDANRIGVQMAQNDQNNDDKDEDEDEEHDDYGFNKRPSVQGVKPQFVNETDSELKLPISSASAVWPYYSERGLTRHCVSGKRVVEKTCDEKQNDDLYLNCPRQSCLEEVCNPNTCQYSFNDKSMSRGRYNKSLSPPPNDISRSYQQTMVYIPYNHVENIQPPNVYYQHNDSLKVSRQVGKEHGEPIYNQHHVGYFCNPNILSTLPHTMNKEPFFTLQHFPTVSNKNEFFSPFFAARSTQTPTTTLPTYKCYNNIESKKSASEWKGREIYTKKISCGVPSILQDHQKNKTDTDLYNSDDYYNEQLTNGFTQSLELNNYLSRKDCIPISPMKTKFIERGKGTGNAPTLGSTSPTSSQNSSSKFLFYAMNV